MVNNGVIAEVGGFLSVCLSAHPSVRLLGLVIAHRLSTIRDADIIAVVNNGIIAEVGGFQYFCLILPVNHATTNMMVTAKVQTFLTV